MSDDFINIAAYKFVELDKLAERKSRLLPMCRSLNLKGTILLAHEGINLFLAGTRDDIGKFIEYLRGQPEFHDIPVKESESDHQPFTRMLVRLKKEIISMGVDSIQPDIETSPKISPATLKQWLDEGKELTLLDVRNDYEIEVGTFENAVAIGVDHFRLFPEAIEKLSPTAKQKPMVMFCTGGIRCEKAGPLMERQGFEQVYQLDGGILKYFEDCGGDHYNGDCFVFDKRVAVAPDLAETDAELCYACQAVLSHDEQNSENYNPPVCCPKCYRSPEQIQHEALSKRAHAVELFTNPLPGSVAYDNIRPMNVPLRFDHQPVIDFLLGMHARIEREYWIEECKSNRIVFNGEPLKPDQSVRAGWRVEHLVPLTTEPDVNSQIEFLYEDDDLIVVNKPAPLPMHACGRFNRNTLDRFVNAAYPDEQIRILHRLDTNTTGVVVMARKKSVSQQIHPQFVNHRVGKVYLARVMGNPTENQFRCDGAIRMSDESAVGSREIATDGKPALTEFKVLERFADDTSLIQCQPVTGRTNQIRLHLSHLGFPISGDPTYSGIHGMSARQGLSVDDPPMCLHAWKLRLTHPRTRDTIEFTAPRPDWCEA